MLATKRSANASARGAQTASAGFVSLNVIADSKEAEALTLKLGVLMRAPAVLVFKRPDTLLLTLNGFHDHETIAQAAINASH